MSPIYVRRCSTFLGIFAFVLFAAAKPADPPSTFWGCWVVTRLLPTPGISGLNQKRVNAIVGTRIIFTPMCARSGRTVVKSPVYSTKVVSDRDFFRLGSYVELSQIGVHAKQVTEVELALPDNLSDMDFPGSEAYLRKNDIVISVEGDYFVAVKAKAKASDAACTCEAPEAR